MQKFSLNSRLQEDCTVLLERDEISFLLHQNAEVFWFILVPHTQETEFHELDLAMQQQLLGLINRLSAFIQSSFKVDKLNLAMIGNVVSQMHIHVIGRSLNDAYWPDVVWGRSFEKTYTAQQVDEIQQQLIAFLK